MWKLVELISAVLIEFKGQFKLFSSHLYGHVNLPSRHLGLGFRVCMFSSIGAAIYNCDCMILHCLHVFNKNSYSQAKPNEENSYLLRCFFHKFLKNIQIIQY